MSILSANTNKPWMAPEYDIPVLENEEMWAQRVIDDAARYLWSNDNDQENK